MQNKKKGFTLIEMLVAVALFSVASTISVGAILSLVDANKKEQALKSSINNLHFAMESMSREIRTGTNYYCGVNPIENSTRNCALGEEWFGFTSSKGGFIEYKKTGTQLERRINSSPSGFTPMTSPEIVIDTLSFYVIGSTRGAGDPQPLVTIVISGTAGIKDKVKTNFSVQSTITQRVPDF